ncbi:MAG: putative cobalt transport system permease protein [Pseudomonadota bacterium]|jgi:cobalt/nickel transport system permease protein
MSHVHRPDGRLRLAATLTIGAAAALTQSLLSLFAMLLAALLAMAWLAINRRIVIADFVRRLLRVNVFLAIVWLTASIDWEHFAIDETGASLAAQMSLRVNIVTLAASMLLIGMSGLDLGRAAVGLGLPVALGALLAQLTRQLSLLTETKTRLDTAMRARAYRPKFGFRTLQVSAQMVAWLIVHALTKAERLSLGLRARGWNTTRWPIRENIAWRSLPKSDWSILVAVAIIIGACLLLPDVGAH